MFDFIKGSAKKYIPTLKMKSVSRAGLDLELRKQFKRIKPGIVLDVGSRQSPYKKYIPFKEYMRLDIDNRNKPDICSDLQNVEWESNYFDTVIATQVLEHIREPQKAIDEIYRLLKPGGVCVLSTPFIFPYHPDPKDYYRFTQNSLSHLFRKFGKSEIYHHGNRFQSVWQIINYGKIGVVLNIFNPIFARIHFKKTRCPCGFVVYAIK